MGRSGSSGGSRSGGGFRSSGGGGRSSGGRRSGGASRGGFSGGSRSSGGSSWGGSGRAGRSGSSGSSFRPSISRPSGGFGGSSRPTIQKPSGRPGGASSRPPVGGFGTPTRWSAPRPPSSNHSSGFGGLFGGGIRGVGGGVGGVGGGGSRPAGSPSPDRGTRGCGCLTAPVLIIALVLLVMLFGFGRCGIGTQIFSPQQQDHASASSSNSITVSTIKWNKLESGVAKETGYYTDELGWIRNASALTSGMKNFYKRTGVWPYLYITDTVDGTHDPTDDQLDTYAKTLYEELFEDEGHLLLLFFEYDAEYAAWYVTGNAASTVIDSEAADILLDYIDRYYFSDLSDEVMFSKAFDEASQRMMHVTVSPWVYVLGVFLVLVILGVALFWWAMAKKKKKEEEERLEQILHTPLETYEDADLKQREEKYTGGNSASQTPDAASRQDEVQ